MLCTNRENQNLICDIKVKGTNLLDLNSSYTSCKWFFIAMILQRNQMSEEMVVDLSKNMELCYFD